MFDLNKIKFADDLTVKLLTVEKWGFSNGIDYFDKQFFKPVQNEGRKVEGCLWTSPVKSEYSWIDYIRSCEIRNYAKNEYYELCFKQGTRIAMIENYNDLLNMPYYDEEKYCHIQSRYIDFEKLATVCDCLWVTTDGLLLASYPERTLGTAFLQREPHIIEFNLYGWDCETVLIFNPDCVLNVRNKIKQNNNQLEKAY